MQFLTPTAIFGILVVLFLLVYGVTSFIIFYHLIRFGIGTQPKKISIIFLLGSVVLFFFCTSFFILVDFTGVSEAFTSAMKGFFNTNYL